MPAEKPVVLMAGPTASGKSALALRMARLLDGIIVNADALQVYRDLRILSARPSEADEAAVPHRLYGYRDGADPCSAADWAADAMQALEAAWRVGCVPIVVGGTGLYLRTLIEGIAVVPDIPPAIRAEVRDRMDVEGPEALHAELRRLDPEGADRLNPGDRQRIARALEVLVATGRPLRHFQQQAQTAGLAMRGDAGPWLRLAILPERTALYERCLARFHHMIDQGALGEVERLLARRLAPDLPVMKAVGVAELGMHLAGDCSLDEAIDAAAQQTRRYAKRQYTWLRNQFSDWTPWVGDRSGAESCDIASLLQKHGLTLKH